MDDLKGNISEDYRKLTVSKFLVYASFVVTSFFAIYSFFMGNMKLFFADGLLFLTLFFIFILFRKKSMLLVAKSVTIATCIGLLFVTYTNSGSNSVMLWAYVTFFPIMFLFGYKKGAILTAVYCVILFLLCYTWVGTNISLPQYIRFIFVGIILGVTAYLYEYAINTTMNKLNSANDKLHEMSKIDFLTTLYNRRYFDDVFPKQIKIARRNHTLLAFAMADIDHFKEYNDVYGHQAGDEALKEISLCFKESLRRPDDYVFRLGGEEFGILFTVEKKENGLKILESIRKKVEQLRIAHSENSASPFITISTGLYIAEPSSNSDYETIYRICDDALYLAKADGKNRVKLA